MFKTEAFVKAGYREGTYVAPMLQLDFSSKHSPRCLYHVAVFDLL